MPNRQRYIIMLLLLSVLSIAPAQQPATQPLNTDGNTTLIYLEKAQRLSFDQQRVPDGQLLTGDVRFRHGDALMYCDSAYFFQTTNSFQAFSNIRIVQGDTIFLYGDQLYYDGNSLLATLKHNVRMENSTTTLTTDTLYYDRMRNVAYYLTPGTIADELNSLKSHQAEYHPDTKQAIFKDSVHLTNPNFVMDADTLHYNTVSHVADIVGPTTIVYHGQTTIYSTLGWYNTRTEHSALYNKSLIEHQTQQTLTGDTILYDKPRQFAQVYGHMLLTDTTNHTTLCGNYGYYNQLTGNGMATDSAMAIDWTDSDSLFMHADTLYISRYKALPPPLPDSILAQQPDSMIVENTDTLATNEPDSVNYNTLKAFWNVRLYRRDLQAIADSMFYDSRDSIMHLYREPILWSDNSQITGLNADIYMQNGTVHHAHITGNAIVVQQLDTLHYNQMQGKELYAYVRDKELYRVDVNGNTETVFYPEDDGQLIGVNKTLSSFIKIFFKDKKVERAVLTPMSEGTMYPLDQIDSEELYLSQFFWAKSERPQNQQDIFSATQRTPKKIKQVVSAVSKDQDDDKDDNKNKRNKGGKDGKDGKDNKNLKNLKR